MCYNEGRENEKKSKKTKVKQKTGEKKLNKLGKNERRTFAKINAEKTRSSKMNVAP